MPRFLLFCRPGFERDCAEEANKRFAEIGWAGYAQPLEPHGLVGFQGDFFDEGLQKRPPLPTLDSLVFSRFMLEGVSLINDLPAHDRATPLAEGLAKALPKKVYRALVLEHPDTNDGRALAPFCKKFSPALHNALKRMGIAFESQDKGAPVLHVVFLNYEKAYIGYSTRPKSQWRSGIPRLKFPEDAPSRSTLKLEEAFLMLLSETEREQLLDQGSHAADLGASPGGWSYQLVKRGFYVTAIDHGKMDENLLASGMLDHKEQDAYKYKPNHNIDLLVCDMIDKPQKVTSLMARWFTQKQCRWAIFNLKLPMKKRYAEWEICKEQFWKESALSPDEFDMRASHLYHNREEITVLVKPKSAGNSRARKTPARAKAFDQAASQAF